MIRVLGVALIAAGGVVLRHAWHLEQVARRRRSVLEAHRVAVDRARRSYGS